MEPLNPSVKAKLAQARSAALQGQFCAMLTRFSLPVPILELEFAKDIGRKWRFDFAWAMVRQGHWEPVALECDGGLFSGGRHVRGAALLKEHDKMNEAAVRGWRILRTTPDALCTYPTILLVARALGLSVPPIGKIP